MSLARWPYLAFDILDATWFLCGILCLAFAAALILRKDAIPRAERLIGRLGKTNRWAFAVRLYFPFLLVIGNLARFRIYYLTSDSANMTNEAWNFLHGYGLTSVLIGMPAPFSVHFAFTDALLSPLLLIWNSSGVMAAAQGFALGMVPLILFALARRQTGSKLVPWLIFLLALAHPTFQELIGTILDNSVYALPCFVAAAYFFETDRAALGLLFGVLMFSAREQVPFITFGIGLYIVFRRLRPARLAGAALMAASALIWIGEMKLIAHQRAGWACYQTWGLFKDLGGTQQAVLARALERPWDFVLALFVPPEKLLPVLAVLGHAVFLPLFAGAAFLPALFVWIPHQLAQAGCNYQGLHAHYGAFVLGPLLWAALKGLLRVHERCGAKHRGSLIAVLLLVAGWGFLTAPRFYSPDIRVIPKAWESAAPKALALIPPDAAVWCDSYLAPQLATRRYLKILPRSAHDCGFVSESFLPDYVLMSAYWARKGYVPVSGSIIRLLRRKGFEVIFQDADLLILANPRRNSARGAEPERLDLRDLSDEPITRS